MPLSDVLLLMFSPEWKVKLKLLCDLMINLEVTNEKLCNKMHLKMKSNPFWFEEINKYEFTFSEV
jgi:hypothetical protein